MKRWRVAFETAAMVLVIAGLKVLINNLGWEFIEIHPLFSSVVAGGIFVLGLLVAGTMADYKEAERMPAEMVAALEAINEDCRSIHQLKPSFDLVDLRRKLSNIITTLRADLTHPGTRECLAAVNALSDAFIELERLDVPANYIVRLRAEQAVVRKAILRIYHIQRIDFLPSAYILIQTVVGLIIASLVFMEFDPLSESIVVLIFIAYFFIYLTRLLRILDTPFRVGTRTQDDVSRFLLKEFADRIEPR
jgi:hypothetical protein